MNDRRVVMGIVVVLVVIALGLFGYLAINSGVVNRGADQATSEDSEEMGPTPVVPTAVAANKLSAEERESVPTFETEETKQAELTYENEEVQTSDESSLVGEGTVTRSFDGTTYQILGSFTLPELVEGQYYMAWLRAPNTEEDRQMRKLVRVGEGEYRLTFSFPENLVAYTAVVVTQESGNDLDGSTVVYLGEF